MKGYYENFCNEQRWSRGHKARGQGQGHKKIRGQGQGQPFRGQTLSRPRTGMLEAKAKDQGHKAQVLSKKKKNRSSQKFFRRSPKKKKKKKKKKRFSQKFFKRSPRKNAFQKIFQPLHKILTFQKILLSSSRGQANFRGLEASRPRPRPRTSKSVLEDVLEAKDVLEDSTSGNEVYIVVIFLIEDSVMQKSILTYDEMVLNFFINTIANFVYKGCFKTLCTVV